MTVAAVSTSFAQAPEFTKPLSAPSMQGSVPAKADSVTISPAGQKAAADVDHDGDAR